MAEVGRLIAVLGRRTVLAWAVALVGLAGQARAYDEIEIVDPPRPQALRVPQCGR